MQQEIHFKHALHYYFMTMIYFILHEISAAAAAKEEGFGPLLTIQGKQQTGRHLRQE